jgi:hypothetical protein
MADEQRAIRAIPVAVEAEMDTTSKELYGLKLEIEENDAEIGKCQAQMNMLLAIEASLKDRAYQARNKLIRTFDER